MCLIPNSLDENCNHSLESSSFHLLELAANNDLMGLKHAVEEQGARADGCARWYCRLYGFNKMASVERSPIMIAALFGSIDVLQYLLDRLAGHGGDINGVCGEDEASALHCAMASGTRNQSDVVQLLLRYGADPAVVPIRSAGGSGKANATPIAPLFQNATPEKPKPSFGTSPPPESDWKDILPDSVFELSFEDAEDLLSNSQDLTAAGSSRFSSSSTWSPKSTGSDASETQDSLQDRTFDALASDVKSSIYSTDEFRMYSFKVRPCSRAYSHDWTECPFAHPGENARRRDPRRYHYSCVPCPDFRKGACRHGDACEYAHGVFESWLHPAQYRTRLCKDGTGCTRKVCFFAHTMEEVRPLYMSTDCQSPCASPSSVKSPSLGGAMNLVPSSPSAEKTMGSSWTKPGLPALRLPEGISHGSRLRASLSARDMALDGPSSRDLFSLSTHARINAAVVAAAAASNSSANSPVRDRKPTSFGSSMISSPNFEDIFCNSVSPRSPLQMAMQSSPRAVPKLHDRGMGNAALEELIASMTGGRPSFHGRGVQGRYDADFGQISMPVPASPPSQMGSSSGWGNMGSPTSQPIHAEMGLLLHQHGMASSPTCLSPAHRDRDWGSPTGKPEWSVSGDVLTRLRKSNSCKA